LIVGGVGLSTDVQVLGQQQEALTKLSQLVKSNEFDVKVIDNGLKEIGR
jgi:hypothetical protein